MRLAMLAERETARFNRYDILSDNVFIKKFLSILNLTELIEVYENLKISYFPCDYKRYLFQNKICRIIA